MNKVALIFGLISLLSLSKTFSQTIIYEYNENGCRKARHEIVFKQINNDTTLFDNSINNNDSTSISQIETIDASFAGNKVIIYPNPVKYDMVVEIENFSDKTVEINVCDIFGKSMEKIKVSDNRTLIDFSQKTTGTYLLKMTINNKSEIYKIIKE